MVAGATAKRGRGGKPKPVTQGGIARIYGAASVRTFLAEIAALGDAPSRRVHQLIVAERRYLRTGAKAGKVLRAVEALAEDLGKLSGKAWELCAQELYARYLAALYSGEEGQKALAALREAARTVLCLDPKDVAKFQKEALAVQLFVPTMLEMIKLSRQRASKFPTVFAAITERLPLDDKALTEVVNAIINNERNVYGRLMNRRTNPDAYEGDVSRIKGAIFEALVQNSDYWRKIADDEMQKALAWAKRRPRDRVRWVPEEIGGSMMELSRGGLKLTVDWAVLIVNDTKTQAGCAGQAFFASAGQFKAKWDSDILTQSARDRVHELVRLEGESLPTLLTIGKGSDQRVYQLIPPPADYQANRYAVNTAGAKMSPESKRLLTDNQMQVHVKEDPLSAEDMAVFADGFIQSVLLSLYQLTGKDVRPW